MYELNRSKNKIKIYTPNYICIEYCKSCGIEINKVDEDILNYLKTYEKKIEKKEKYNIRELKKISVFVNGNEQNWKINNLLKAFNHIITLPEPNINTISYTQKNNQNPESYDKLTLYELCLKKNIFISKTDQHEDLIRKFELTKLNKEDIYNDILYKLSYITTDNLYRLNKILKYKPEDFKYSSEKLEKLENIDICFILKNSILSFENSIICGIKYFNMDLTESHNPYTELKKLCDCKINTKPYQPTIGTTFCEKYLKNPLYYKIDKFWKPHLSNFYSLKTMNNLLSYEFIDSVNPKEELNKIYNSSNFYPGIFPHTNTEKNKKECITFKNGKLNIIMTVLQWSEYFKEKNDLKVENILLDERCIKKLLNISSYSHDFKSLKNIIQLIKSNKSLITEDVKLLIKNYQTDKEQINIMFHKVFECSMYMRGWKVLVQDYPFKKEICNANLSQLPKLNENTEESLKVCLENISKHKYFCNLPLLTKVDKNFKKLDNNNLQNILHKCEKNNYRITSNILFFTYHYYYCILLENVPTYNIMDFDVVK